MAYIVFMQDIFKDLVVVEFASVLAGPAVGMFFAELGASVIKIENPNTGGDVTRNWKLPKERSTESLSAYYASVNYQKEIRLLDLKDQANVAEINALIQDADIVLTNFRRKSGERLGLSSKKILELNILLLTY